MAIYVKYASLDGEVDVKGYEKWMEVQSLQWGVGRGISSASGGGASKRESSAPSISEIVVTKTMDSISPLLLKEAIGGGGVEVKIHLTRTDAKATHVAYQKYILTNTLISGYSISSGGDRPTESISLNFGKFDSEYIKIDSKFGTATTGHVIYDIEKANQS
jgi:type VI secretion system secreted protein Hcp